MQTFTLEELAGDRSDWAPADPRHHYHRDGTRKCPEGGRTCVEGRHVDADGLPLDGPERVAHLDAQLAELQRQKEALLGQGQAAQAALATDPPLPKTRQQEYQELRQQAMEAGLEVKGNPPAAELRAYLEGAGN
jgi:hypothetical protein